MAAIHSHDHRHHQAAVALNNTGVSLLLRGFCRDAMETFKDAIQIMKRVVAQGIEEGSSSSDGLISDLDIDRALRRKSQRCAYYNMPETVGKFSEMTNWPVLYEISSQDAPTRVYGALALRNTVGSSYAAFPIKIDPIDSSSSSSDDIAFQTGAMLYNLGVAHVCMAAVGAWDRDARFQEQMQAKARRTFQRATSLLSKLDSDTRVPLSGRSLLLRMILMHGLLDLSIFLNLTVEYNEYAQAIQYLLRLTEIHHHLLPISEDMVARAA
jgi:signal transduction histidine kinase